MMHTIRAGSKPATDPFAVLVASPRGNGFRLTRFASNDLDGLDGMATWLTEEQIFDLGLQLPCNSGECDGDPEEDACLEPALPGSNWCERHH